MSSTALLNTGQPPPPPLPSRPPPSTGSYQFGPGDWSQNSPEQQNGFSFRPPQSAPQYPVAIDQYRPTRTGHHDTEESRKASDGGFSRSGRNTRSDYIRPDFNRSSRGRGNYHHRATADRPLLNFKRGNTPEQLLGMNDHQEGENRFLDIDDMSDSAEEAMDESDLDEYEPPLEIALPTHRSQAILLVASREDSLSSSREIEVHTTAKAATKHGTSLPKWSNPEYYTALPPPDESQRRKRDVVKLIRKARVAVGKNTTSANQVAANDDFISFTVGDNQSESDNDDAGELPRFHGKGVPGAPSGPRSRAVDLSTRAVQAPGTNGEALSAEKLGPPPSNIANKTNIMEHETEIMNGTLKRKRSEYAVAVEPLRPPKRKKGTAPFSNGYVLEEWAPGDGVNVIPWISQDHGFTENLGFRLHKEICDFYEFVKPQKFEQVVREELLHRLQYGVEHWKAGCELHCFGSFAAGLYLPTADMDVVVLSREFRDSGRRVVAQSLKSMFSLARYLQDNGIADPASVEVISKAKVPLIKFVDRITSLRIDMSFENETGLVANHTFQSWKQEYPAMPIIATLIKQFLMMRGLNEVVNGGLGGFSVTCLVTSLLQNMPRVRTKEIVPEHHLGEILLEFLDLYGNQFDLARTGIQMQPPGYFDKRRMDDYNPNKNERLAIVDPNNPDNDISGGSKKVALIFARFSRAREEILSAMRSLGRQSLLDWMLAGDYNSFLWQRERLRTIYSKTLRSPLLEDTDSEEVCSRRDTQSCLKAPETLPDSLLVDNVAPMRKSAARVARPATTSLVAFASQPERVQDENLIGYSSLPEISNVNLFHHESQAPIHLQEQSDITPVEDSTTSQDGQPIVKAMAMAQEDLRAAEKAQGQLQERCRLEKQRTGRKPKLKAERRQIQFQLDRCRATITFLSLSTSTYTLGCASSGSGRSHARLRATTLLKVATNKANDQVKARNDFRSPSGAGPGSNVWNEEFRASAFKSRWSHIPKVPAKLDRAAAEDLLKKHGMDAGKASMEIEVLSPNASVIPPRRKNSNRNRTSTKPVGGSSKAHPITID